MNRFRVTRSVIPNLFTSMNMFAGFISIIYSSEGRYINAAWLIIIAGIFDALDGVMARLTKSSSELGVELDSLSDIVSFGAAPSFLIYSTYLNKFNSIGIVISSFLMLAGGFRLARFNIQTTGFEKKSFKGLPIPISAITVSGFVLAFFDQSSGFNKPYSFYIIPLIILLSLLMVSRIKYDSFPKFTSKGLKEKPFHIIFIAASLIILYITSAQALFFIFAIIILFGIFRHIFIFFSKKK